MILQTDIILKMKMVMINQYTIFPKQLKGNSNIKRKLLQSSDDFIK